MNQNVEKRSSEIDRSQSFSHALNADVLMSETFNQADDNQQEAAIRKDGRLNGPVLIKNAKLLLASGDTKLAKQIFRSLIEQGEMLATAYSGMGAAFEMEGKLDLAIKAYREAIIYDPTYGVLLALAELYLQKEDFSAAVGTLLRAQNLPRLNSFQQFEIHKALGNCYLHVDQLINAESHYRKAYSITPQSDILHVNIGSLALKKGDPATALLHFKEAARIDINNSSAYAGIGLALMQQGDKKTALENFDKALQLDSKDSSSLANLIRCAYETKTFGQAIAAIQNFIQANPLHPNLLFSLAGMYFHEKQYEECRKECERLQSMQPGHNGAQKLLNLIAEKLGE